ncbi:hypothetical protein J6590_099819 [Homalodisca vitripennis]|nr:hypothetical protein J6590_084586 [Homalodisca vitripennis]KAG8294596.1 hypothetical protein J6590_099819 [Homalodisca vitripennis]
MTPHPDVQLPIRDLWVSPYNDIRHRRGYSLLHEGNLRENVQPTKTKYISGKDTMQVVLRPYIFLGQCFGLIPVKGIFSENPKDLITFGDVFASAYQHFEENKLPVKPEIFN